MNDLKTQFQFQAYLDGELSPKDAREVEKLLANDPSAQGLANELKNTRNLLRANEPEVKLPVAKDFYFSQIRRRIETAERQPRKPASESWWLALRRMLMPLSGLALVLIMAVSLSSFLVEDPQRYFVEVENISDETSTTTFRFQSEKMFVVWISTKETVEDDDWDYDQL